MEYSVFRVKIIKYSVFRREEITLPSHGVAIFAGKMVLRRWFSQGLKRDVKRFRDLFQCRNSSTGQFSHGLKFEVDRYNGITVDLQGLPETISNAEFNTILTGELKQTLVVLAAYRTLMLGQHMRF